MTDSEITSLRCFDEEWRSPTNLKRRGLDADILPFLTDHGFVTERECGSVGYQISDLGRQTLQTLSVSR